MEVWADHLPPRLRVLRLHLGLLPESPLPTSLGRHKRCSNLSTGGLSTIRKRNACRQESHG